MQKQRIAGLTLLVLLLAYAGTLFVKIDSAALNWVYEVVPILVPAAAAIVCIRVAREKREHLSWFFFGAGAAAWAAGDTAFTVLDKLGKDVGGFSFADVGYLLLIPLWGAAIIVHPIRRRRGLALAGPAINASITFVAASTLTVALVLKPILAEGIREPDVLVNLAYPVGDLALLAIMLGVLTGSERRRPLAERLITLAVAIFTSGDIWYAYLQINDKYHVGLPVDLTWIAAFICVAAASRVGLSPGRARESIEASDIQVSSILGLVTVLALGVAAAISRVRSTFLVGAGVVAFLVLVRYTVLLVENRRLVRTLEFSNAELREVSEAQQEFVAAASHQIRTPLTSIKLLVDELDTVGFSPEETNENLREIKSEIDRLESLTRRLLSLATDRAGLRLRRVSVRTAIGEAAARVRPLARARLVSIEVAESPDAIVEAPEGAIEEVLLNVLDNAVKYSPDGEHVDVLVDVLEDVVRMRVVDRGPGIGHVAIEKVFQPFYRAARSGPGHGLGLPVARRLCELSGASIDVASGGRGGTVVTISWPRVAEHESREVSS